MLAWAFALGPLGFLPSSAAAMAVAARRRPPRPLDAAPRRRLRRRRGLRADRAVPAVQGRLARPPALTSHAHPHHRIHGRPAPSSACARRIEVEYDPKLVDDAPRLLKAAATADAIVVRNRTQVRGELLAALAKLPRRRPSRRRAGQHRRAGCEARGMQVIPATGANALSVAEYVVTSALVLLRGAYMRHAGGGRRAMAAQRAVVGPRGRRQDAGPDRLRLDRPAHRQAGAWPGHAGHRLRRDDGP